MATLDTNLRARVKEVVTIIKKLDKYGDVKEVNVAKEALRNYLLKIRELYLSIGMKPPIEGV